MIKPFCEYSWWLLIANYFWKSSLIDGWQGTPKYASDKHFKVAGTLKSRTLKEAIPEFGIKDVKTAENWMTCLPPKKTNYALNMR